LWLSAECSRRDSPCDCPIFIVMTKKYQSLFSLPWFAAGVLISPPLLIIPFASFWWAFYFSLIMLCFLCGFGMFALVNKGFKDKYEQDFQFGNYLFAWVASCFISPFLGWFAVNFWTTLTEDNWQRFFIVRILFSVVLPVIFALPLLRYLQKDIASLIITAILLFTLFPSFTCYWTVRDLIEGKIFVIGKYESIDSGAYNTCWLEDEKDKKYYTLPCELNIERNENSAVILLPNTQQVLRPVK